MFKNFLALCALAALLAGCGSNGDTLMAGPDGIFPTPPSVVSIVAVAPVDKSTGVAVVTDLLVTFNEPVILATVKENVACASPCVSPAYSTAFNAAGTQLTVTFAAPLDYAQAYTATVTAATGANLAVMAGPYSWGFDTADIVSSSSSSSSSSGGSSTSSSSSGGSTSSSSSSSSSSSGGSTSSSSSSSGSSSSSSSSSGPLVPLGTVQTVGDFGGTAGMTSTGTLTTIVGDLGTNTTTTSSLTGFHDSTGNQYTETTSNIGTVTGTIYSCTQSTIGSDDASPNAVKCSTGGVNATQMWQDADTAYLQLTAMPFSAPTLGDSLAGLTLGVGYGCVSSPCVYQSAPGSFSIVGGDLTLTGSATDVFVFQMASSLTVGDANGGACQNVTLAGTVLAKNVFWEVGSAATINAPGGCTFVGTVIASAGVATSTVGNVGIVDIEGRLMSLNASVTIVDTVINVPAP